MSIKTIFVGPYFEGAPNDRAPADSLIAYAIDMASIHGAHLSICIGVSKMSAPSISFLGEARSLIASANQERRAHAETYAQEVITRARSAGVTADVNVEQGEYLHLANVFASAARLADAAIMQPNNEVLSLLQGVTEEVLFNSGGAVITPPVGWVPHGSPAQITNAIVAWDGSARAARAIGDAIPLLARANVVEIVTIGGDPDPTKRYDGAEVAPRLARHCKQVRVTHLPAIDGDIPGALIQHAQLSRADLIVMGAYAHSKFRQLVLGGVTRRMIGAPPVPVLMSY